MSKKPKIIKARRLLDIKRPPVKRRYGPWLFKKSNRTLILDAPDCYPYKVDLDRMESSAQCLDWIFQVAGKPWATPEILSSFILAIEDLINPQATLCSFGQERNTSK